MRQALLTISCALSLWGCGAPEPWAVEDPREVARYFLSAAHSQRGELMWKVLDPSSQRLLEERAAAINKKTTGEAVTPQRLLTSAGFAAPYQVKKIDLVEPSSPEEALRVGRARLSIQTQLESTWPLEMIRAEGTWRVVLTP
jgi:hypothetical protein